MILPLRGRPSLAGSQLGPSISLLYTPPFSVPANMVPASRTSDVTDPPQGPLDCTHWARTDPETSCKCHATRVAMSHPVVLLLPMAFLFHDQTVDGVPAAAKDQKADAEAYHQKMVFVSLAGL